MLNISLIIFAIIFYQMQLHFYKYQATGNDFVIIDNRLNIFPKNGVELIKRLCDRKFGIGADGLILLENDKLSDFKMIYYNADGHQSSMCGNGGRAIVQFAHRLGLVIYKTVFVAIDGIHEAEVLPNQLITLKMVDVEDVQKKDDAYFLNTGSPHHVVFVENIEAVDVYNQGKRIRNEVYGKQGSNVNFVEIINSKSIKIRTYERGVEDETLSCGTGATACAIAFFDSQKTTHQTINVQVMGGELQLSFKPNASAYQHIFLTGPAVEVFSGTINI